MAVFEMVRVLAKDCGVVLDAPIVGVFIITAGDAPAPVPMPEARLRLAPAMSVPVMPLWAFRVCATGEPLTSTPSWRVGDGIESVIAPVEPLAAIWFAVPVIVVGSAVHVSTTPDASTPSGN